MEIVGDFQTSVRRALEEIDPNYLAYPGLVVCGTHSPESMDIEDTLEKIKEVRERGLPFLGICFGHQLAAIEYARNVMGIPNATSEEFGPTDGDFLVYKLPRLKVGLHHSGDSFLRSKGESYWNNYEVQPEFIEIWKKDKHFISVQYHPEYQSSSGNPHPLLALFIDICKPK